MCVCVHLYVHICLHLCVCMCQWWCVHAGVVSLMCMYACIHAVVPMCVCTKGAWSGGEELPTGCFYFCSMTQWLRKVPRHTSWSQGIGENRAEQEEGR